MLSTRLKTLSLNKNFVNFLFSDSLFHLKPTFCANLLFLARQNVTMNVFDRKTKLLQKERAAKSPELELYDYLKDEVGYRVADRIFDIKRSFEDVVELGCGRGHVTQHIINDCVKNLTMCDISSLVLENAKFPESGINVKKLVVDEEQLPFAQNSLDLVISSLSLHWVNDLPGTFSQIYKSLKNDGAFLGAVFGGDTLFELRSSLQLAETERVGGITVHISPFVDVTDIGGLLSRAGYTMLTIDSDEIVVGYPSMFELMWDLKGMGENNCTWQRSLHLRRDVMLAAGAIYNSLYGSSDKIPATFQILYFLAWKPDPSQPKPAERGSATHSLRDLDSVTKKKKG